MEPFRCSQGSLLYVPLWDCHSSPRETTRLVFKWLKRKLEDLRCFGLWLGTWNLELLSILSGWKRSVVDPLFIHQSSNTWCGWLQDDTRNGFQSFCMAGLFTWSWACSSLHRSFHTKNGSTLLAAGFYACCKLQPYLRLDGSNPSSWVYSYLVELLAFTTILGNHKRVTSFLCKWNKLFYGRQMSLKMV